MVRYKEREKGEKKEEGIQKLRYDTCTQKK